MTSTYCKIVVEITKLPTPLEQFYFWQIYTIRFVQIRLNFLEQAQHDLNTKTNDITVSSFVKSLHHQLYEHLKISSFKTTISIRPFRITLNSIILCHPIKLHLALKSFIKKQRTITMTFNLKMLIISSSNFIYK